MWQYLCHSEISLKKWEDGTVIFNDADAHLQCLSPVYGQMFELIIQDRHWTAFELTSELLDQIPSFDDVEHVENALGTFVSSNLIERVAV